MVGSFLILEIFLICLLQFSLEPNKINKDLIHVTSSGETWRELIYKKAGYIISFEKDYLNLVVNDSTKNFLELGGMGMFLP